MSHQLTFADSEFSSKRRQTRKEIFLSRMEQSLPWKNLAGLNGACCRPYRGDVGDGEVDGGVYPDRTMQGCVASQIDCGGAMGRALPRARDMQAGLGHARASWPARRRWRRMMELEETGRPLSKATNRWPCMTGGTVTPGPGGGGTSRGWCGLIKNKQRQRDPEMHQTKKGNQWHFGMKAHIGVDAKSGLTHSLVTTAANEHDLNQLGNLLHGEEQFVSADAGYQGAPQREELAEVDVDWLIAERPGKVRTLKQHPRKNKTAINIEYMKASIRAKVEHPFRIIKRQFGFVKARYKGLLKNDNQLAMLFTLANLFRADQMIRQWERSH
ncbi:IS5 family transposase [Escherichia coli]|uniref:IS5 family transposase n=1 Tax=Escherichia coli TaxID=562 RepID=UPI0031F4DB93